MRFTLMELREVLPLVEANKLINMFHAQTRFKAVKKVSRYIPFKSRYGTVGTTLTELNQYDLDDAIKSYEDRILRNEHPHVFKKMVNTLNVLHNVKRLFEDRK